MKDNLKTADKDIIATSHSRILPNRILTDKNLRIRQAMTKNLIIRIANGFQIAFKASHFLDFTPLMQVLDNQYK